jgi:hypothetical protein
LGFKATSNVSQQARQISVIKNTSALRSRIFVIEVGSVSSVAGTLPDSSRFGFNRGEKNIFRKFAAGRKNRIAD